MSPAQLWHRLGRWRWVGFCAGVGVCVYVLSKLLFPGQAAASYTLSVVLGLGTGWAWARYQRTVRRP